MLFRTIIIGALSFASAAGLDEIRSNDNRTPAGRLSHGVLAIELFAGSGTWFPEQKDGPGHHIYAFGEVGRGLSNPGPLIRVPAGTEVQATVRNTIKGTALHVHGLHDRPGKTAELLVPAGETRSVRFRATAPGTYFYWASTRGVATLRDRYGPESQLVGAFIVDSANTRPSDHVFMVGIEDDSGPIPPDRHTRAAVVNGLSWPHSQVATLTSGDTVQMRWINVSDRVHPIHLHGFYFTVGSHGDMARDTAYDRSHRRQAITELLFQGQTASLTWVADRPGNWLMHCHMAAHMSPHLRGKPISADMSHHFNHTLNAMAGIVVGWKVRPRDGAAQTEPTESSGPRRMMRLLVQQAPHRYGTEPGFGFVLQEGNTPPRADSVVIPGAPIVLRRGEPVQIMVVNHLSQPTAVHWHGMELESYFDGVSGWSGDVQRTSPQINARDSFAVRFTPPRAGTFIYHAHFNEERQLSSGLYGPLIVLEPGASFDPDADRQWVLSQGGPAIPVQLMLNGMVSPVVDVEARRTYRIRLININPTAPVLLEVLSDTVPIKWRAIAKDGADLPAVQRVLRPARFMIGVGEAYDFELTPEKAGELHIRGNDVAGRRKFAGVLRVLESNSRR
jgi:FtsP/CotA-like multicopper oxidase with cupredoxin domain